MVLEICYLCKNNKAKRSNIIETDDPPKNWLQKPSATSKHCVCDTCMDEIEKQMEGEGIESIYD